MFGLKIANVLAARGEASERTSASHRRPMPPYAASGAIPCRYIYTYMICFPFIRRMCTCTLYYFWGDGASAVLDNVFECNNIFTYPPDRSGLAYGSRKFIFKTWDFLPERWKCCGNCFNIKFLQIEKTLTQKMLLSTQNIEHWALFVFFIKNKLSCPHQFFF